MSAGVNPTLQITDERYGAESVAKKRHKKPKKNNANEESVSKIDDSIQKLDPRKIFYCFKLATNASQMGEVYCVPIVEMQPNLRDQCLKDAGQHADFYQSFAQLDQPKRLQYWKEKYSCPVYEVISLNPPRFHGTKAIDFTKKYGKTFQVIFEEQLKLAPKPQDFISFDVHKSSEASVKLQAPIVHPYALAVLKAGEKSSVDLTGHQKFAEFKQRLQKAIIGIEPNCSPFEFSWLIWDTLSRTALHKLSISDELKKVIEKNLFLHWEKVLHPLLNGCNGFKIADEKIVRDSFSGLLQHINDFSQELEKPFLEEYSKIIEPLQFLATSILNLPKKYYSQIAEDSYHFFNQQLRHFCNFSITIDKQRELLKQWFQPRAQALTYYLELLAPQRDMFRQWLDKVYRINAALKISAWNIAFQEMVELTKAIEKYSTPLQEECVIVDQPNGHTIAVALYSAEKFRFLRLAKFARSLENDFREILSHDNQFHCLSKLAWEQMRHSFQLTIKPIKNPLTLTDLMRWSADLADRDYPYLQSSLNELDSTIRYITALREELNAVQGGFAQFSEVIDSKRYDQLPSVYLAFSQLLSERMEQWIQALPLLANAIKQVQDFSFLALTDASLSSITLETLRMHFAKFNAALLEIIKPPITFFSAFHALIEIDNPFKPIFNQREASLALHIAKGQELICALFQTNQRYFDIFAEELSKQANPLIEIEDEESPEPQVNELLTKSIQKDSISTSIGQIYQQTKTRKIKRELQKFLKEKGVRFSLTTGKGDHFKLYLNGKLIVLPQHAEWKPGTKRSIQNSVVEQLQEKC